MLEADSAAIFSSAFARISRDMIAICIIADCEDGKQQKKIKKGGQRQKRSGTKLMAASLQPRLESTPIQEINGCTSRG